MKIYLEKAIFVNRAPFDRLELNFSENEISVLSAVNGRGKTTIISHIVDAFYEMAKKYFLNEFEDKQNKYYRVSSAIYNLNQIEPSFVYLRFKYKEQDKKENIDYLDIRNVCTKDQYNKAILLENKILFDKKIEENLLKIRNIKVVSSNFDKDKDKVEKIFKNILTYFPSYRYEIPGYLNDPYKIKTDFKKESVFSGYLPNRIEVISGLKELANWIMDIVLDNQYLNLKQEDIKTTLEKINIENQMIQINQLPILINSILQIIIQQKSEIQKNLNIILKETLISKKYENIRFGIGERNSGSARVQVVDDKTGKLVYPSIFNLSSGESALLCLFGEILKQADNIKKDIKLEEINGIVLIDEVDKHLHIKLQKEILPNLFKLFPNVQFIVSSHSPFLSLGLAQQVPDRSKIKSLDTGLDLQPENVDEYEDVYKMMIKENERFKKLYESLEQKIQQGTTPLIITEGKTDIQHIKKAKQKLNITDLDIDLSFEFPKEENSNKEKGFGDDSLKKLLEQVSKIPNKRKIIAIFDRDNKKIINDIEKEKSPFKDYGNNVYAFCIPKPKVREKHTNISIEFYYSDKELKSQKDGKSLYFDNELNFDSERKPISFISDSKDKETKKIWDENIGDLNFIHSKARFAELIEKDDDFIKDFDFSNFNLIFDRIKEIINHQSAVEPK